MAHWLSYLQKKRAVELSRLHRWIGSGLCAVARRDFSFPQVGCSRRKPRWLQLHSGCCWLTGLRAQRDDVTSYSDDCLSAALDILPRCSPHPAEEWEWCFHISDALNLLSKTISSELFYFLCGTDLNVAEPVKHTRSFFFFYVIMRWHRV